MKRRISVILLAAMMMAVFPLSALAAQPLEYTVDAPSQGSFGTPTSDNTVYVDELHQVNVDLSKNNAYVPPAFGSPEAYIDNRAPLLTPGASNGSATTYPSTTPSYIPQPIGYTAVSSDLYYSGGHIGTLKIAALDLSVKVYQGTDDTTLAKGIGHFTSSSIWEGNVALAAHNRGANNYFGQIHTLDIGDEISFATKLGTRTYEVYAVTKINNTDTSVLTSTGDNILTLITCVRNQSSYRWCVQGIEK